MSRIRSKDTGLERALGSAMFASGLRYRKHYKITGTPDFVFPLQKVAVFCDSSFWHGRDWDNTKSRIKVRQEFWIRKIEKNIERDHKVNEQLESEGWVVLRFWDDRINSDPEGCVRMIKEGVEARKHHYPAKIESPYH